MKENPYANMDEGARRIAYLIAGFIRGTITEKEHDELDAWVNASDQNMKLFEELTDEDNIEANLAEIDKINPSKAFQKLQNTGAFEKAGPRFNFNTLWIAAASILVVGTIVLIFWFTAVSKNQPVVDISDTAKLQPGGNKATLLLADGSVIDLGASKNGLLTNLEGSRVNKPADGELVYEDKDSIVGSSSLHTLSTPVGGQYRVTLPDGTIVWLNAATSLTYPSRFTGSERTVRLSGEAFFEVARNTRQPFRVQMDDSALVTVLGTHFNVMAYNDEKAKEVTLLEGSVEVGNGYRSEKITPGFQATITPSLIRKSGDIDTAEIAAWKNGQFIFHDASIEQIMRQIQRWYNAKVIYRGKISQQFNATISRSESLEKLLRLLELNGYVHFKIENQTIYVLP